MLHQGASSRFFAAEESVVGSAAGVLTGAAHHHILTRTAEELIVAATAADTVIALLAADAIGALPLKVKH